MHLLIYEWKAYGYEDIKATLTEHNVTFDIIHFDSLTSLIYEGFADEFLALLKTTHFDAVFSFNFCPNIAQVCYENNIKYISWTYDCPLNMYNQEHTLDYPTSYSFFFDRTQVKKYQDMGMNHIYHMPLATNTKRLSQIQPTHMDHIVYDADISFVGKLYTSEFPAIWHHISPYLQGYLKSAILTQQKLYGCNILDDLITDDLLRQISLECSNGQNPDHFNHEHFCYSMYTYINGQERQILLSTLSHLGLTKLFSTDKAEHMPQVIQMFSVDYFVQMPMVFKNSKINLNITSKSIPSGIPLRVIDIMGCGGFLLTNYQHEIAEFFVPDNEVVFYSSIDEAVEKTKFYLAHDDIRQKIAQNGFNKIDSHFTYEVQLKKIFTIAGLL